MANYRMTPKRRAALAKAQKASARKRRKVRNRGILIGSGVTATAILGTGIAAYAGRDYIAKVAAGGPRRRKNLFDSLPPAQLALPAGRTTINNRREKALKKIGVHHHGGVWKVDGSNSVTLVHPFRRNYRARGNYNAKRRAGLVKGYEKKVRSKYDGLSPRTLRRKKSNRG